MVGSVDGEPVAKEFARFHPMHPKGWLDHEQGNPASDLANSCRGDDECGSAYTGATIVESEHAMSWSADGATYSGGSSVLATRLPF
jgi:hypothetical protein